MPEPELGKLTEGDNRGRFQAKIQIFFIIFCIFFLSFSGGVMIYFDRIEVVNYLIPSAGKLCEFLWK